MGGGGWLGDSVSRGFDGVGPQLKADPSQRCCAGQSTSVGGSGILAQPGGPGRPAD